MPDEAILNLCFKRRFSGASKGNQAYQFDNDGLRKSVYSQIRLKFLTVIAKTLDEFLGRRVQILLRDCIFQTHACTSLWAAYITKDIMRMQ
jgi:hypothetical protein